MARLQVATLRPALLSVLFAFAVSTLSLSSIRGNATAPKSCPITKPPSQPFVPPSPYPGDPGEDRFWFGTEKLWTHLFVDGTWRGLRTNSGYGDKVFWWRQGYNWHREPAEANGNRQTTGLARYATRHGRTRQRGLDK